jgi:hypothetical protein
VFRLPSYSESLEVARGWGRDSEAPHLWQGLVADWNFTQGGGSTLYDIAGGNHGTLTNMDPSTDWVMTEKGYALDFDGSNDEIRIASPLNPSGLFALSMWFYSRGNYVADNDYCLVGFGTSVNMLYLNDSPAGLTVFTTSPSNATALLHANTSIGAWHHVVMNHYGDGNIDGLLDGVAFTPASTITFASTTAGWRFGRTIVNSKAIDGFISSTAIWNRDLQPFEGQQLYEDPHAMHRRRPTVVPFVDAAPPTGAIMNQMQFRNLGSDLFNGTLIP